MGKDQNTTHFGFQEVPFTEKAERVADIFRRVASKYDLMNDLMSLGLHRFWKRFTLAQSGVREGQHILDVAGGTGDLTLGFLKKVGNTGRVVLSDINESMLARGRERILDQGYLHQVEFVQANAEMLPFEANTFDCVSIAFGLRNVTDKEKALRSMYNVLKPGGKCLILEFSKPVLPLLAKIYDRYSFSMIPRLGEWICKDRESYQYLVESIRMHPDQNTLKNMMTSAGFENVKYHNLTGGIVALHIGYRYA
ncbi:MAG: bifunctional demethylmenaquinone methyltransferase/2-methoxy-6-polyprenyl-1,4-benzoquinol methylase UbiE [Gammaproteobacteria bacterium]|nr:bifunctional demethylmenaquinone methyltransferase/2-methoxy-6-polyprenyl-1,4-benzoquinol methylase UbiE [Gammaproteobacteria bacterium]